MRRLLLTIIGQYRSEEGEGVSKFESRDIVFLVVFLACVVMVCLGYNSIIHNIITGLVAIYFGLDVRKRLKRG